MRLTVLDVAGNPEHLITPKGEAEEFLTWMLTTNTWKEYPEILYDRAIRARKALLERGERKAILPKPAS
jgi:hypothetical protein